MICANRDTDTAFSSPDLTLGTHVRSVDSEYTVARFCLGPRGVRTANWLLTCPPSMTNVVFRSRCNSVLPVVLQGMRAGFVDSL